MTTNPFRPTTGASPPDLIGRQAALDGTAEALREGPGAPGRVTLFTGRRGVGKTVMLNEVVEVARSLGWLQLELTATPGLMSRIDLELARLLDAEDPGPRRRLTGVHVAAVGGASFEPVASLATDVRAKLSALLDALQGRGVGLMLTVDEVHGGVRADLRELGALSQHMVREDRQFALVMAGLPSAVSGLLSDEVLTFLRRAERYELGALDVDDVQDSLVSTIVANGRSIDPVAARRAAEATHGYPYLVQLVGYHVWRQTGGDHISLTAVDRGVADALARLAALVHEPALQDLSEVDRLFLAAMAVDDGRSAVADLARRLGKDRHYVNTYRRRLIEAQMVEPAGRGYLRFTLPHLEDTLRERSPD